MNDKMSWAFQDGERAWHRYFLCDMTRDQIREAMQWCLKNQEGSESDRGGFQIGGYSIREWILAFTVRLFDPKCE